MAQNENLEIEGTPELTGLYANLYSGLQSDSLLEFFIFVNLALNVMRFHDFTGMGFLGTIRLPVIVSSICIILVLPKLSTSWPKQMKIMLWLLLFELVRGIVGYAIIPTLVLNDSWQMNILGDLFLTIVSIAYPVALVFNNGLRLKKLLKFLLITGFFLGIWSILHGGHGPGGYLGDENDNCLVLVYLLPFPFFLSSQSKNLLFKLVCILVGLIIFLGAVFTNSRGGFLGIVMVVLFQFLLSRKKLSWIVSTVLLGLIVVPFIPGKYYEEIHSIKTESGSETGTMQERIDTWKSITRMWLNPRNMFFGTGLENGKWNIELYEDEEAGFSKRSVAGREAHCLYFQILGDLGIWGLLVFGGIILISIKQLRIVRKETRRFYSIISTANFNLSMSKYKDVLLPLSSELVFLDGLASTILCSWLGALSAGIGISVAYYPTLWFLSGICMAIYLYWTAIRDILFARIFENFENKEEIEIS